MRPSEAAATAARGLSLLEILVVLVIFSIGWFAVLPNLNLLTPDGKQNQPLERLNAFLAGVRLQATRTNSIERFSITPGESFLVWREEKVRLPATVSRCLVNGRQFFDRVTEFRLYPAGNMDDVRITLDDGQVLSSNTLAGEFRSTP